MQKVVNYSPAQVALIVAAAESNGGRLNADIAKALAANPAMNKDDGTAREPKSIIAKISRMVLSGEVAGYDRKQPETKDGKPITKKSDLVTRIATAVGIDRTKLESIDKGSKGALELLADAVETLRDEADAADEDDATGTDG